MVDATYIQALGVAGFDSSLIYPKKLPPEVSLPAVTMTRVHTKTTHALGADNPVAARHIYYQFKCFSPLDDEALATADSLRSAILRAGYPTIILDEDGGQEKDTGLYWQKIDAQVCCDE